MTKKTLLRFVNTSQDMGRSNIVFFQKNGADKAGKCIAWQVVRECGYGNSFPITYTWITEVNMVDWNCNYSPRQLAAAGSTFNIIPKLGGKSLSAIQSKNNFGAIEVQNCLAKGALHVNIYRSGFLVAQRKNVIPGQLIKFDLAHRLCIAMIPDIKEGDVIPENILPKQPAEFSLLGIERADICMTGGSDSTALRFALAGINAY